LPIDLAPAATERVQAKALGFFVDVMLVPTVFLLSVGSAFRIKRPIGWQWTRAHRCM
jgi:hypothetical protein